MKRITTTLLMIVLILSTISAQNSDDVYVDQQGVMRWPDGKEVYGFGINYTVPFAHAYRSAVKLGVDHKKAIDDDVYHFARLGFDAYRVHVWDTEISDTIGNLLENDHLELFDYMLNEMKKRGMKFILTPIAFWGNGWPERDEETPGFSHKYGKGDCLTNEEAIEAQENYLFQFLNHVNPYTGLAYKNDPDMVAFEISNEPHHGGAPEKVTAYIQRMVDAMRKTDCGKPIFYNISHSVHLAEAYFSADIQGGTFQWYPTGLGFQKELQGNMLPNVDNYHIPFDDVIKEHGGAKMVYEFDAADVGRSYIYPAIARSFRTAGIQWATHFSYDPTFMAQANTEYNTHYMNLVYAPQKALSLKIASEVFHRIPMYEDFGNYPENSSFEDFRVSYEDDLAELLTEEKFFYTNNTSSVPKAPKKLKEIAGFGNSPVVSYAGLGAYFLDQIEKGVWRLEVLPDAIWIDNVFGRNSLDVTRAVIDWSEWAMSINLPDLEEDFSLMPINEGNSFQPLVNENKFNILPGTYLVNRKGVKSKITGGESWNNIRLNEFAAPKPTVQRSLVLHTPAREIDEGIEYKISATVVSREQPKSVTARILSGFQGKTFEMQWETGYTYSVVIPAEEIITGYLRYNIILDDGHDSIIYPTGMIQDQQSGSRFSFSEPFEVKVLDASLPIYLFDAYANSGDINIPWSRGLKLVPLAAPNQAAYQINPTQLFSSDPENPEGNQVKDYSMRYYFADKISGRPNGLSEMNSLVIRGSSMNKKECLMQVGLINKKGDVFGAIITLNPKASEHRIKLSDLRPVNLVTLPRPYPSFLPYFFEGGAGDAFEINDIEELQISIGPGIPQEELDEQHGVAIENVWIE